MIFKYENIELDDKQKEIDKLWEEYFKKGFKDFTTFSLSDDEILERLKECLKQNKSYEQIYDKLIINDIIDY